MLEGSVSSGKTWISLVLWAFWIKTMPDSPNALYLMAARSLTTLKNNCLLLLQELVGESNFTFSISSKEGMLFGRRILLEGANDAQAEAKIRGLTLQGAYCDELTKMHEDFFKMLLSRLRLPGAKLFATTNPDAPGHWLKEDYIDRAGELDFLDVRFTLDDNTKLPRDYVDNIKREYTGVFYDRFILGLWSLAEGLIYPMYAQAIQTPPEGKPEEWVLSIDYGTRNAFAALLWGKYGETWYCLREYYYSGRDEGNGKTNAEYAADLDRFTDGICDEYNRIKTYIDPSAAAFIEELRRRKKYRVIPAENDVLDGIQDTATCLQSGRIKISPACKCLKKEMQGYVWDDKAGDDRPVKVDDHACDAMRYFVRTSHLVKPKKKYIPTYER